MKTVFVHSFHMEGQAHIVDGERLARDTQDILNRLEQDGYELASIVPVVSGRYEYRQYDGRTQGPFNAKTTAPDTCASWGFSMTDGVMIVARPRKTS